MSEQGLEHKQYLKRLAGLAGAVLGIVFVFNYVVDPFNKNRAVALDLPKAQVAYKMHYPLYKSLEFQADPKRTIILGDSRADALKTTLFSELGRTDVYNMAYGGGTAAELVDSFWFAVDTQAVEEVWIGLPFNLYRRSTEVNRFEQIESLREGVLPYYLSTLVTRASVLTLGSALVGEALKSEVPDMDREAFWRSQLGVTTSKFYSNWQEPAALKQELRRIAQHCQTHGIRLVFFIPPTHTDLQHKVDEFGLTEAAQEFREYLSTLATLLDFDTPNAVTEDRALFKDPYHATETVSRWMAQTLIGVSPDEAPAGFVQRFAPGAPVTTQTP